MENQLRPLYCCKKGIDNIEVLVKSRWRNFSKLNQEVSSVEPIYLPIPIIFLPYRVFIGKIIPTYLKTKMFGILKTNQPCIIIGIDICYHPSFGTGICIGETHQPCSRVEKSGKYAPGTKEVFPRNTQAKKLSKSHLKYVLVLLL